MKPSPRLLYALTLTAAIPVSSASASLTGEWTMETGGNSITDQVSGTVSDTFGSDNDPSFSSSDLGPSGTMSLSYGGTAGAGLDTNVTGSQLNILGTGAKTFTARIQTDGPGDLGLLDYSPSLGKDAGEAVRLIYRPNSGGLRLEVNAGAANTDQVDLADGNTHFIAAVIPDNAQAQDIDFYIDGTRYDDQAGSTRTVDTGSGGVFDIGDDQNDETDFKGLIDDVRIYDQALTDDQLSSLQQSGSIPEPASLALLGLGGLAMLGGRRRKR